MKKSLKKNISASIINTVITSLFPLVTFPYITHVLHAEDIGVYNFSTSIISYFQLIGAFGITTYAIRTGSQLRDNKDKLYTFCNQVFTINIRTTLCAYLLLIVAIFLPTKIALYRESILILSIPLLLAPLGLDWAYNIYEDFEFIAIRNFIIRLISTVLIYILIKSSDDFILYMLIMSFSNILNYLINYIHLKKYISLRPVQNAEWNLHKKSVVLFFINSLASTIYLSSDKTLLGFITNNYIVGIYSVAASIYAIFKMGINAGINAIIPRLSNSYAKDIILFKSILKKTIGIVTIFSFPMAAGIVLLNKDIVYIISGEGFKDSSLPLIILAPAVIFASLANVFAYGILVSQKKESIITKITSISAITNFVLNFIFIPIMGASGAALTTLIAEIIMCFACAFFGQDILMDLDVKMDVMKSVFSSFAMFAVGLYVNYKLIILSLPFRLAIVIAVCVCIYFFLQVILKNKFILNIISLFCNFKEKSNANTN